MHSAFSWFAKAINVLVSRTSNENECSQMCSFESLNPIAYTVSGGTLGISLCASRRMQLSRMLSILAGTPCVIFYKGLFFCYLLS